VAGPVAIRVLVVEDSPGDARLMVLELEEHGYRVDWTRVHTAPDMRAALEESDWDLVLADHSMPRFSSLEALLVVHSEGRTGIPVILVSGHMPGDVVEEAIRAGAHAFVSKDHLERLPAAVAAALGSTDDPAIHGESGEVLSAAEVRVLELLARTHLTTNEIARILFVSHNTIKTHTKSIYRKLGVSDRHGAAEIGRRSRKSWNAPYVRTLDSPSTPGH